MMKTLILLAIILALAFYVYSSTDLIRQQVPIVLVNATNNNTVPVIPPATSGAYTGGGGGGGGGDGGTVSSYGAANYGEGDYSQ